MHNFSNKFKPKTLEDIIGQEHLIGKEGIIRLMIDNDNFQSFILYGDPGTGKTSIANVLMKKYLKHSFYFNASNQSKKDLVDIINHKNVYDLIYIVIDEIHRLKKDIQDYLLQFLESNNVIIIGLTSTNPFYTINIAIRSRCHLFKSERINKSEIYNYLKNIIIPSLDFKYNISDDVIEYISICSNEELRSALKMLELIYNLKNYEITLDKIKKILSIPNLSIDNDSDGHYTTLSALQKSIRGSDVNASLYYLARLIKAGDLDSICRRLLVIAYEDIGLGNPNIGPKAYAAIETARQVGFPEAKIPLATLIVDMALSPKSNSAYLGIKNALDEYKKSGNLEIPFHITDFTPEYKYPHDYNDCIVEQKYLPSDILSCEFYEPKETGNYERALKERYDFIKKFHK